MLLHIRVPFAPRFGLEFAVRDIVASPYASSTVETEVGLLVDAEGAMRVWWDVFHHLFDHFMGVVARDLGRYGEGSDCGGVWFILTVALISVQEEWSFSTSG
jgi:hypothetical protein